MYEGRLPRSLAAEPTRAVAPTASAYHLNRLVETYKSKLTPVPALTSAKNSENKLAIFSGLQDSGTSGGESSRVIRTSTAGAGVDEVEDSERVGSRVWEITGLDEHALKKRKLTATHTPPAMSDDFQLRKSFSLEIRDESGANKDRKGNHKE